VLNAPGIRGINTLDAVAAGCTKVLWHWRFDGIGSGVLPVRGFNYFTVNQDGQVERVDLEFNSIAWGIDQGRNCFQVPGSASNSTT
jgi:hypothetical protein